MKFNIIDKLATKVADKIDLNGIELMELTQEYDLLKQKFAASELTVSDYQNKIANQDIKLKEARRVELVNSKEIDRLHKNQEHLVKEHLKRVSDLENEIKVLSSNNADYEFKLNKQSSRELNKQITKLQQVNSNQLKFIEILQTIASAKSDKTQLKDAFSHNLSVYIKNNFNTVKQASDKLGINKTTLSDLKNGKIAVSFDNLDILDSKLCEYFKCSVYELVTVKMEASQ